MSGQRPEDGKGSPNAPNAPSMPGVNPFDPWGSSMAAWKGMRDSSMETWSKAMIDFVNSEAYSQATAQALDTYLTVSQPFQKVVETTMTRVLTQLNMPTRGDVISLAERLTNIELRLDDLDARFEEGAEVTPASLRAAGLATRKEVPVKVLARGELSKPLTVRAHDFSRAARERIEAAGGTLLVLERTDRWVSARPRSLRLPLDRQLKRARVGKVGGPSRAEALRGLEEA